MNKFIVLTLGLLFFSCEEKETRYNYIVAIDPEDTQADIVEKAAHLTPSDRQWAWQQMEMTAFLHFGINTFYDQEWGHGTEDPENFDPSNLDTDQWVETIKNAGIKMAIVTAKHHDGFCLWPSEYTEHSVKNSPWKEGKGDVVGDLSKSCQKYGIKFGVYLSPWDRNAPMYGTDEYNDYFINQLTELLSNYGPVDEVWFDGANGEGPNGKRQVYDWERYYSLIRKLQPKATIAVMGPDVRWVGTESGYGRDTEWSVIPADNLDQEKITAISQQDAGFVPLGDKTQEDLGSREKLKNATSLVWYPSEVDVSIRPGWFYHDSQDDQVKTPEKLIDIYYSSVGKNSLLLLNLPPNKEGRIHKNDSMALVGMNQIIQSTFSHNIAMEANENVEGLIDDDINTFWTPKSLDDKLTLKFNQPVTFDRILLQENILSGQRVENFKIEARINKKWEIIKTGTTVGYKRLLRTERITTDGVRLHIDQARALPEISTVGLFLSPPTVTINPASAILKDSLSVELSSNDPEAVIRYTLDGSIPTLESGVYEETLVLTEPTTLSAAAFLDTKKGFVRQTYFPKFKYEVKLKSEFSQKFQKRGAFTLVDGEIGSGSFTDGKWLGFEGNDLEAEIDLGENKRVDDIHLRFLESQSSWVFRPIKVMIQVSVDGNKFNTLLEEKAEVKKNETVEIIEYQTNKSVNARYIRVFAENSACPDWHDGNGGKCWIFIDEIKITSN